MLISFIISEKFNLKNIIITLYNKKFQGGTGLMMCQNCGKNPATVHLINIVNGQKSEMNLCAECVGDSQDFAHPFTFGLDGLIDDFYSNNNSRSEDVSLVCETCGLTYDEFLNSGKLGCADCYEYFAEYLNPTLLRLHGSTFHDGKIPKRLSSSAKQVFSADKITQLKEMLQESIKSENYEEAARIRDKIRSFESNSQS